MVEQTMLYWKGEMYKKTYQCQWKDEPEHDSYDILMVLSLGNLGNLKKKWKSQKKDWKSWKSRILSRTHFDKEVQIWAEPQFVDFFCVFILSTSLVTKPTLCNEKCNYLPFSHHLHHSDDHFHRNMLLGKSKQHPFPIPSSGATSDCGAISDEMINGIKRSHDIVIIIKNRWNTWPGALPRYFIKNGCNTYYAEKDI